MKYILSLVIFICLYSLVTAQNQLKISDNKTSHIIGKERITYLQVGDHTKLVAEIVPEHPNMIRVKALERFEGESSLTLVCANRVYSLFVSYKEPEKLNYLLEDFHSVNFGKNWIGEIPEYILREWCTQILSKGAIGKGKIRTKKDGLELHLKNIYLKQDVLFFELEIKNNSNMSYEILDFYWWIDDKKEVKATNVQEYLVDPIYQHYKQDYIPAKAKLRTVFALPKLTIPDKRILRIEILEKALGNTGRKLSLELNNKTLLKAKTF